jgi:hypothetical protein
LGWGTNNYINNDKELVYTKTTQLAESAFKNVIFLISSTSNNVLNMFEEQTIELDKLCVEVNSITTKIHVKFLNLKPRKSDKLVVCKN